MDEKTNTHKLILENQSLRKEILSLNRAHKDNLIHKLQLDAILDNAPVEIFLKDREGRYLKVNKKFEEHFGVKNQNLTGLLPSDFVDPRLSVSVREHDLYVLKSGEAQLREQLFEWGSEDQSAIFSSIKFPVLNGDGEVLGLGAIFTDITVKVNTENKLQKSNILFRQAESMSNMGHWTWDFVEDKLMSCSDQFARIFDMTASEALNYFINSEAELEVIHPDDRESFIQGKFDCKGVSTKIDLEYKIITISGNTRHVYTQSEIVLDNDGVPSQSFGTVLDITERKEVEAKLERLAHYDLLTSLPNRVLLADRLSQSMRQCQRRKLSLAVAYLDLDGFKVINDTHGHDVGDELLIKVSNHMKEVLRRDDTLARIGGDEFIVIIVDLEKVEDSKPVLELLLKAAAEPVTVGDAVLQVTASIGVTHYPQDGVDTDQLIRHADQAMYIAKEAGKNRFHLFDTALDHAMNIRRESIADIRLALGRCEFVLHYQPKVNMRTGEVIGVEALVRWQHPDRGLVPPLEFLPIIEGRAISLELGEWVLNTALAQISQWRSLGLNLPISVNISAYQLQQGNFTTRLSALLAAHPEVNPQYLELEILETSVLDDIKQVSTTMKACQELGVHFALDDFGTGYSSLTHLRRLPAYLIKIDQSFVRDILEDVDDLAIVEGVVGLAKAFQRKVIAEGVETIAHGVALLQLGCELAQGYGIARPMPAEDIPKWVSSWKPDNAWKTFELTCD